MTKCVIGSIFHEGKPRFFARIDEIDLLGKASDIDLRYSFRNKLFVYLRSHGSMRLFVLLADEPRFTKSLYSAIENAVPWYTTVLNMDDEKRYGKPGSYWFLNDFNLLTPGLQIVHLPRINKFILTTYGGITSFDDPIAMDHFASKELHYSDLQLEQGSHNIIG